MIIIIIILLLVIFMMLNEKNINNIRIDECINFKIFN